MKKTILLLSTLTLLPTLANAALNATSPQTGSVISTSSTVLSGSCDGTRPVSLTSYVGTANTSCSNNRWNFGLSGIYSRLNDGAFAITIKQGEVTSSANYTINKNPNPEPLPRPGPPLPPPVPGATVITITSPDSITEGNSSSAVFTANKADFVGDVSYNFKYRDESIGDIAFSSGVVHFNGTQPSISVPLRILNDGAYRERSLVGEFSTTQQNTSLSTPSTTTAILDVNANDRVALNPVKNTNYTRFVSSIDGNPVITSIVTLTPIAEDLVKPLTDALKVATPGTRIIIPDGTYSDQLFDFSKANCPVGASNRPIIIQAATPGGVIFNGKSSFYMCGAYIVIQGISFVGPAAQLDEKTCSTPFKIGTEFSRGYRYCDNCALRKILIDGFSVPTNPNLGSTWIYVSGDDKAEFKTSKGLEISDSRFINKENYGTIIYWQVPKTPPVHRISRNYFSRPVPKGKIKNGLEAIRIGDSATSSNTSNSIVEHNVFENANGDAEDVSMKSDGNIVRYNTFITSGGTLSIRIGNKNVMEGNYFVGKNVANTGGIRISGSDNLALGNHIEGLNNGDAKSDPGTNNLTALGLYNGDGKPCTSASYCAVVRAFAVGNFFYKNNTNIIMGAAAYGDSKVPAKDTVIARNIFDTTSTMSSMIYNRNANLDRVAVDPNLAGYVIDNNRGVGKVSVGATLTSKQVEVLSALEVAPFGPLGIRIPQTKKDQYNLRIYRKRLTGLGLSADMLSRVNMLEKNIYEISAPLTSADVGQTDSDY